MHEQACRTLAGAPTGSRRIAFTLTVSVSAIFSFVVLTLYVPSCAVDRPFAAIAVSGELTFT